MIEFVELGPLTLRFQIGTFVDAINFTSQADRDQYTDEQIQAMMQARYDNWVIAATPQVEPEEE